MASPVQITANRLNAKASTGPTSVEGKNKASQNAVQLGLFSKRDFVPEDSHDAYARLRDEMLAQLNPKTILEEVLAREIVSAAWRLERCAQIEANFDDTQNEAEAVTRARTAASRILWKSTQELRKIQSERCTRRELSQEEGDGLASLAEMYKGMAASTTYTKKESQSSLEECEAQIAQILAMPMTKLQNEPEIQTARNASCPCGSGNKYKRCCGSGAPPKLT